MQHFSDGFTWLQLVDFDFRVTENACQVSKHSLTWPLYLAPHDNAI